MIAGLDQTLVPAEVGAKAATLSELHGLDLGVPDGFVLPASVWRQTIAAAGLDEALAAVLAGSDWSLEDKHLALMNLTASLALPSDIVAQLAALLKPAQSYAVRSSGLQEDLAGHSFAGQYVTFLDVVGTEAITQAVIGCYRSAFGQAVLAYLADSGLTQIPDMAVIIQEMVPAYVSGVLFTLNPVTGADTEYLAEVTLGLGEELMSGHVDALQYRHDWFDSVELAAPPGGGPLSKPELAQLWQAAETIQQHFGFPCDIEFAFAQGNIHILQSRPITRIGYAGLTDAWTTADFKDGGVSSDVYPPYMWSLYDYIWERSLAQFVVGTHMLQAKNLRQLGRVFYGRPYWNLSVVKESMSRVPGYKEREFDAEYGIVGDYEDDGAVTRLNPANLIPVARIGIAHMRSLSRRIKEIGSLRSGLLETCASFLAQIEDLTSTKAVEIAYRQLVEKEYLRSEMTYFSQIFLNTVHQGMFKESVLKVTDPAGYFALIGGLNDLSHLRPFYDMWDISRAIRDDAAELSWWRHTTTEEITAALATGSKEHHLPEVADFISAYGYHSERELDITQPCYSEDPAEVVLMFAQTLEMADSCSPQLDRDQGERQYQAKLAELRQVMSPRAWKKLFAKVEQMRSLLWWREELRDVSTRYYHVIRLYTLRLAQCYVTDGILGSVDDIWFTTIGDLWDLQDGKINASKLRAIIERHRRYYGAYRNFLGENEIGAHIHQVASPAKAGSGLAGLGCNSGVVSGRARVISSLAEIDSLAEGDILVTRFTDTGWTRAFALLGAVVTEYGGVLCHAAIVSREYGIPCVVAVKNATALIPDGALIRVDGATGDITWEAQKQ